MERETLQTTEHSDRAATARERFVDFSNSKEVLWNSN